MLYLILFLAFFLRLFPRLMLPYAIGDDGYHYLSDADNFRNHNRRAPEHYHKTLFRSKIGYAYLYPYILALFPEKYEIMVERLFSPVFDTLMIICSTLFFQHILEHSGIESHSLVLMYAVLISVLPAYLRIDTGPRAYQGNARVAGQFVFLVAVVSFYFYLETNAFHYLLISAAAGAILFPLSTFASQAFLFSGIFIGILFPSYYLVLLLSLVLLYIFSFGKAIKLLTPRFRHLEWYFKFYQKVTLHKWKYLKHPFVDYKNQIVKWWELLLRFKLRSVVIYFNDSYNPIHLLVTSFFFLVGAFFFITNDTPLSFLSMVCLGCLIVFGLTMLKSLLFLGESYRYLEYAVTPGLVLFFLKFKEATWFTPVLLIWIGIALVRYAFYQFVFYKKFSKDNQNHIVYRSFFNTINPMINGNVFASVYYRTKAAYFGTFNYLGNRGFIDLNYLTLEDNALIFGNYPGPSGDYKSLIKRFNLEYWLTTNEELETYLTHTKEFGDFKSILVPIAEEPKIGTILYRIKTDFDLGQ